MRDGPAVIAVIGMGAMGASLAARLVRGGARVVTTLQGRSADTVARAEGAGVQAVAEDAVLQASMLLSVVPPAAALDVASHWSTRIAGASSKPVFVDCNAVSVQTAGRIGQLIEASGARFVDGCIIGMPGRVDEAGPVLYLAGELPRDLETLSGHGLRARSTQAPAGAASALKMAYAGFNKGLTGLAAAMVLAATRAGAADALGAELAQSQPHLLAHIRQTLPDMYAKAWRWDHEMQQVGEFAGADEDVARLYQAMAAFFGRLGQDWSGERECAHRIDAFLRRSGP